MLEWIQNGKFTMARALGALSPHDINLGNCLLDSEPDSLYLQFFNPGATTTVYLSQNTVVKRGSLRVLPNVFNSNVPIIFAFIFTDLCLFEVSLMPVSLPLSLSQPFSK